MTPTQKTIAFAAGLILCVLGTPRNSFAITGCNNAYLFGYYNAQVSSTNFTNVLNAVNGASTSTGTTTGSGTTTGATTGSTSAATGLGNNPGSLSGATPGIGRYFFDGNGNIIGAMSGGSASATLGTYSVNNDCSAKLTLNSGATFYAIVAQTGQTVLFVESDTAGGGAVGELDRSTNACIDTQSPQSFAFSYFGAQQAAASTTGTTTGGTTTTSSTPSFQAVSGIGALSLNGNGNFTMTEWLYAGGSVKPVSASGTYAIGSDCSLQLTFAAPTGATTGSTGTQPVVFRGLVNGTSGLLIVQNDQVTTDIVPGLLVSQ